MKAIFTIVAKNYLPLAFVQAATIKQYNPDVQHFILLADSAEGLDLKTIPHTIDTLDVLEIENIESLEFKYNVTEFCTAVKPSYFKFLFDKGFDKVIYLDPDVCLFSSIEPIFQELEEKSIVITPHFVTPQIEYTGTITEQLLLHVGVYNFGFAAVANTQQGMHFVKWWENRLFSFCYQDKIEALHTDQKWIDLVPAFYGDVLHVSKDIGRNMAFWNLHERLLINNPDGTYNVKNRFTNEGMPLMLFHFAGYDLNNADNVVHKHHPEYSMSDFPELRQLFTWYKDMLLSHSFKTYIGLKYAFNYFKNGDLISNFQRRLYRRLIEDGNNFPEPFSTDKGSFYVLLKDNKLLSFEKTDSLKGKDVEAFGGKIKKLNLLLRSVKAMLGFDRYSLLLKFCMRYLRPENQTFLFKEYQSTYKFLNENTQYNRKK